MSFPRIAGQVATATGDPELRFTTAGKAVVRVNLAFNKRRRNQQTNEWEDAGVQFVSATAWERMAENIAESITKGMRVIVSGEVSMREYDKKDGSKGYSFDLNLESIGPDLTYATARVTRNEKGGGSGGGNSGGSSSGGGWGGSSSSAQSDEPPF